MSFRTILVPTDFSEQAGPALLQACEWARLTKATVHVLHVLEWHANPTPSFGLGLAIPTWVQESSREAETMLNELTSRACPADQPVVRAVLAGTPAHAILSYAREHAVDLIVMATHGRTRLTHLLMGSVAESVLRGAPCPILMIRATDA